MKIWTSVNEPGLYFVETEEKALDEEDRFVYCFVETVYNDLAKWAESRNFAGFIWLDYEQNGNQHIPILPE